MPEHLVLFNITYALHDYLKKHPDKTIYDLKLEIYNNPVYNPDYQKFSQLIINDFEASYYFEDNDDKGTLEKCNCFYYGDSDSDNDNDNDN